MNYDVNKLSCFDFVRLFPGLELPDFIAIMHKDKLVDLIRGEIIKCDAFLQDLKPRIQQIHDIKDTFTQSWLVEEFHAQHPDYMRIHHKSEDLKKILVMVEGGKP